jgi:hypothetical protein
MHKPIFLLGAHKSGTSLLRSLFDGHKDVFVVPIEAHFFQHMKWWVDYSLRRTVPAKLTLDQFIINIKAWVKHYNESEDYQADSVARGIFNLRRFNDYVEEFINTAPGQVGNLFNVDTGTLFKVYVKAIHYSIYGSRLPETGRIVEKSVENVEFAMDLQAMFPDAVFIHIVRNPYANLVSIRKYMTRDYYPKLRPIYKSLYNTYYFLYRNRRLIKNYLVIKYEDLAQNPEPVIKHICDVAGLELTPSMFEPTFMGKPWKGNSTSPEQFKGISPNRINTWQSEIAPLEVELINKYLRHVVEEFEYGDFKMKKSVFIPVRKESLKAYIANRFLWCAG